MCLVVPVESLGTLENLVEIKASCMGTTEM